MRTFRLKVISAMCGLSLLAVAHVIIIRFCLEQPYSSGGRGFKEHCAGSGRTI